MVIKVRVSWTSHETMKSEREYETICRMSSDETGHENSHETIVRRSWESHQSSLDTSHEMPLENISWEFHESSRVTFLWFMSSSWESHENLMMRVSWDVPRRLMRQALRFSPWQIVMRFLFRVSWRMGSQESIMRKLPQSLVGLSWHNVSHSSVAMTSLDTYFFQKNVSRDCHLGCI